MVWIMWKGLPLDVEKIVRVENTTGAMIVHFTGGPALIVEEIEVDEFLTIFNRAVDVGI